METTYENVNATEKMQPPPYSPNANFSPQPPQMMQTPPQTQMQPNLVNQTNISMVNPNPPQGGYYPQPPPNPVTYVTQTTTMHAGSLQSSIPIMPMCLAIILCIVNCLIPGFGTIIASFTVFCCANVGQSGSSNCGVFCLNFWIGWAQMFTVFFFLAGWIWSIIWGVYFISNASQYGKAGIVSTTTTTAAIPQPIPQYTGVQTVTSY
ncbi:unnamed protein product [Clavelina lepadiformis]|uniref:Protein SPEC3 n=1 Tax=Clavelina lepadiformis TaxID=159417 RepID=A0ABP0F1B7_CLALP